VSSEQPRLHLRDQLGQFVALGIRKIAPAAATYADQLEQPAPLSTVQEQDVISRQHRDLSGRKQLQDGDPPKSGHPACGATDGPRDKSTSHPGRV
jgi:hypothetical protein